MERSHRRLRRVVEREIPISDNDFKGPSKHSLVTVSSSKRMDRDLQIGISRVTSSERSIPSISLLENHNSSHGEAASNGATHLAVSPRLFPDISNTSRIKVKYEPRSHASLPCSHSNSNPSVEPITVSSPTSKSVGLKNLGNTCFMNSALQCLIHLEPLATYFLKGSYRADINPSSPFKGTLANSFADLLAEMYSESSGSVIVPINFKKIVTKLAPHLLDYDQQDCQEFLRFLLDGLSEDLKRIQASSEISHDALTSVDRNDIVPTPPHTLGTKRFSARTVERIRQHTLTSQHDSKQNQVEVIKDSNTTIETPLKIYEDNETAEVEEQNPKLIMVKDMATIRTLQLKSKLRKSDSLQTLDHSSTDLTVNSPPESQQAWRLYLTKNDSIVTEIFGGQLQSSIECLTCHHQSFCFDPFLDLSLPLGAGSSKCTVENCLESFTAPEFLEGDNAYFCEKCNKKQKCVKRLKVSKCPRILVIHIKRFRYNSIRREKMFTEVDFPMLNLDLSPYLTTELTRQDSGSSYLYDLAAVAHHSGTLNGGHYIAHVDIADVSATTNSDSCQNWMCFNDSRVTPAPSSSLCGPSAYILFYRLKSCSP